MESRNLEPPLQNPVYANDYFFMNIKCCLNVKCHYLCCAGHTVFVNSSVMLFLLCHTIALRYLRIDCVGVPYFLCISGYECDSCLVLYSES